MFFIKKTIDQERKLVANQERKFFSWSYLSLIEYSSTTRIAETLSGNKGIFFNMGFNFSNIACPVGGTVVADQDSDTLTFTNDDGTMIITAIPGTDTINFQSLFSGYRGLSSSSVAIGGGTKSFQVQAGLAYVAGNLVRITNTANVNQWMQGSITSYSGTTLTIFASTAQGSGTISSWNVTIVAQNGTNGSNGQSAYTFCASTFIMPGVGASIALAFVNTSWMAVGQIIYIQNAGYFSVFFIGGTFAATIINLGYPGNATPGATIVVNQLTTCAGLRGTDGAPGGTNGASVDQINDGTENAEIVVRPGELAQSKYGSIANVFEWMNF